MKVRYRENSFDAYNNETVTRSAPRWAPRWAWELIDATLSTIATVGGKFSSDDRQRIRKALNAMIESSEGKG